MPPIITAFEASPDRGRGLARDTRIRWALEEAGVAYEVRLLSFAQMKEPAHLKLQPFGQIPTYEEEGVVLFETGAIVLHIAERHGGLLPEDDAARARALSWMFAALNTVEPPILERESAGYTERNESWYEARLALMEARIRMRLEQVAAHLGEADWLDGQFSAGDLMMVSVLQRIAGSALLAAFPTLSSYVARAEARPAYRRAFAAQLAVFEAASAKKP